MTVQTGLRSTAGSIWAASIGVLVPTYTINWDTGTLVPGTYELRVVGIDNVDNRADVDGTPSLPYVTICIVDQVAPKAIIAGVDNVSGTSGRPPTPTARTT